MAQAALVPCGPNTGVDCKFCHLATLAANVFRFALYYIAIPLSVIFIAWGGLMIMIASGSAERAASGRKIIQAAIIGVLIAIAAFLIVRTTLNVLTGQNPASFGFAELCK